MTVPWFWEARSSKRWVFTSYPTPNTCKLTSSPSFACRTRSKIALSSVTPAVGSPSVRKTIIRLASGRKPARSINVIALLSALSMSVLPRSNSLNTKDRASWMACSETLWSSNIGLSMKSSKLTMANRSPSPSFPRICCSALLACSIFSPAIDPDRSMTKTMSFGIAPWASMVELGERRNRKWPSPLRSRSAWVSKAAPKGCSVMV